MVDRWIHKWTGGGGWAQGEMGGEERGKGGVDGQGVGQVGG